MAQPGGPENGGPQDPDPPNEPRQSGLAVEFCYRHPDRATGVHCTRCERPICTDCMRPAAVGYQCPECLQESAKSLPRSRRVLAIGTPGPVTRVLVGLNLAVFVLEIATGGRLGLDLSGAFNSKLIAWGGLQPLEIALKGEYYRLITATFLHGGLLHVALNMYVLWLLGSMIEPALGSGRFAAVYFISGLTASATSYWLGSRAADRRRRVRRDLRPARRLARLQLPPAARPRWGAAQMRQALLWIGINFVLGLSVSGDRQLRAPRRAPRRRRRGRAGRGRGPARSRAAR